jgi:uncharacterized protein (DUF1800 family)
MCRLLALLLILFAPLAQAAALGAADARHLLNRAGFGATTQEIADFARLARAEAVERLLAGAVTEARTPLPAGVEDYVRPSRLRGLSDEEKQALLRTQFEIGVALRGWWLEEMLSTPSPLSERMTLFWHNHFVSSQQKVKSARLMAQQNRLLRRHALGNFGALLHAVAKDPAMIVYLDSATSRKEQPNENFAREVMELFTLGEGHYTERDVKEAARAFTGWSIEPETGEFKWRPFIHDRGEKTVLGRTGRFDGDEVLDILLEQPATAEFIVAKLWREFVSADPEPQEVRRIAARFRDSGYEVRAALRALFLCEAFWAAENRAALIKSPVDLVAGTLRSLEFETGELLPFVFTLRQLGQDLFGPPNVKGWPGGEAWIDSSTLLARKQFLERLFRGQELRGRGRDMDGAPARAERVALRGGRLGEEGRERMRRAMEAVRFDSAGWLARGERLRLAPQDVLLPGEPAAAAPAGAGGLERIRLLALDPMYQLK